MKKRRVVVIGGGAAGFFAAITCAETSPGLQVTLMEKGAHFLSKVRISGGGRCNVTHACFNPGELNAYYPRGSQALLGPFNVFQPSDTMAWFEVRGVKLKTEEDGRVFPESDSSQTIIDCLLRAAREAGVELLGNHGVKRISCETGGFFNLELDRGEVLASDAVMLATGGCRSLTAGNLAVSLGHTLEAPVPSLFTFHVETAWVRELAGISLDKVRVSVSEPRLCETGPLLLTHQGVSGPVILRISAWGARALHAIHYQFRLQINWVPELGEPELAARLESFRATYPARFVVNQPLAALPVRLWEQLVLASGTAADMRCSHFSKSAQHQLIRQLTRTELPVIGKSLNRDEFVTCGGVRLNEVNFKTMESRVCPRLYFGGELLDIDGLTGGFNFQAAWTTGWIAGRAMALSLGGEPHHHVELSG